MKTATYFFFILLFACNISVFAQMEKKAQTEKIVRSFDERQKFNYQEKIYLHTNKDYYTAGEKVWFRAYRADATSHLPQLYSKYIYVELYNRQNKFIDRVKIHETDSGFCGYIPLWKKLPLGEYCIRVYSSWMTNFDEFFYFKKKIFIINPNDLKVESKAEFEINDSIVIARINIKDRDLKNPRDLFTKCFLSKGTQNIKTVKKRADKEGWINFQLPKKDSVDNIQVEFLEKKPFEYKNVFYIPTEEKDFDLQFMPEGGHWLAGYEQLLAFKAVGKDGKGVQLAGEIYTQDGQLVMPFATIHKGMGIVELRAEPGKTYYAIAKTTDGVSKRVELPQATEKGTTLKVTNLGKDVLCSIWYGDKFEGKDSLVLVAHSRGMLLAVIPITTETVFRLSKEKIPDGIMQIALITKNGQTLCERMVFVDEARRPEIVIGTDKEKYGLRERVNIEVTIETDTSKELTGTFSVAVTDDSRVMRDSIAEKDIVSYLMLASDIQGGVEEPGWYFDKENPKRLRERFVDLVMLTNGWKRFDLSKICKGEIDSTEMYLEMKQRISGKLKNFWGKDSKGGTVCLVAPGAGIMERVMTDAQGMFSFNGLSFQEGTIFIVQGLSPKRGKYMEVTMDDEKFSHPQNPMFKPMLTTRKQGTQEIEGKNPFEGMRTGFYYENGEKVYLLEEAKVVKKKDISYLSFVEEMIPDVIYEDEIKANRVTSVEQWLKENIKGIEFKHYVKQIGTKAKPDYTDTTVIIRFERNVQIYLNDLPIEPLDIDFVEMEDVEKMAFVPAHEVPRIPGQEIKYKKDPPPLLLIYLKEGRVLNRNPRRADFFKYTPLGYQKPEKFYQPKYELQEVRDNLAIPDERTTIYWQPFIRIEKDGKVHFSFYTADFSTTYSVIIEGITDNGLPFRKKTKIIRE